MLDATVVGLSRPFPIDPGSDGGLGVEFYYFIDVLLVPPYLACEFILY